MNIVVLVRRRTVSMHAFGRHETSKLAGQGEQIHGNVYVEERGQSKSGERVGSINMPCTRCAFLRG